MGLRFDPVGGGQFKQAVKAIMEAEAQPLHQLEQRKGREEQKLKLFQEFKGKFSGIDKVLTDLSNIKRFQEFKVDLGDGQNLASVTIDKEKATPGTYQIGIDQMAQRTSVISNGFESADDNLIGMGYIVMKLANGDNKEIFVDEDRASLNGIAKIINDTNEFPVRASVMRDASEPDAPFKLIMTGKKEGKENQVNFPDFYFMDGKQDIDIDDDREAQNAKISVDGFQIESRENDIADFLPGVNLHLKQAREGQPFMLNITQDHQKIAGKVKGLVDQVNQVLGFIGQQNKIDEKTDTSTTFAGDSGLQGVEYRLRNLMHEAFPAVDPAGSEPRLVFLNQIGIEFTRDGQIEFKEEKFTKALEKDYDGISTAITGSQGLAVQLKQVMSNYTNTGGGMLQLREQGLRNRIKDIDTQIDAKQRQLDRRQTALTEQYSRLESTLADMQRQQQYLSATLPGGGGGGNLVQQLLGG